MKKVFLNVSSTNSTHMIQIPNYPVSRAAKHLHKLTKSLLTSSSLDNNFILLYNGKNLFENKNLIKEIKAYTTIDVDFPSKGGKGGFGSLLRIAAAQKKHFNNFDSSRNMSGRRLRDIKNEQRLKEWIRKKRKEDEFLKNENNKIAKIEKRNEIELRYIKIDKDYNQKVKDLREGMRDVVRAGLGKRLKKGELDGFDGIEEDQGKKEFDENMKIGDLRKKLKIDVVMKEQNELKKPNQEKDEIHQNILDQKKFYEKKIGELKFKNLDEIEKTEEKIEGKINETVSRENEKINFSEEEITPSEPINLNSFKKVKELQDLGSDRLKLELKKLGLKHGGSTKEKAERLWSIKINPANIFNPKLLAKDN